MADTTINGLTSGTPTTDDLLVFYDNADGVTKKSAISALPVGAGDMVLASTQTNSGLKTFLAATFGLRNVANTFTSFFTNTNTAARTYTLQNRNGTLSDDTDLATKAALAGSISQVFSVSQLEVGNASDTSITRSSAGVIAVEGVVVDTISGANTLTNKRVTKRVTALSANSATPAINTDNFDVCHITAQTATITGFTMTGTPVDGDTLRISITGTASVPFTLGSSFEASGGVPLSTTTSGTARFDMGFFWNTETSKWRQVAAS